MYDKSSITAYITAFGHKRYRMPVYCSELPRHRSISSDTPEFVIHKAALQEKIWKAKWEERKAIKHKKLGLEMNAKRLDLKLRHKLKIADERTAFAQQELHTAYHGLVQRLEEGATFDWDYFKTCSEYPVVKPVSGSAPVPPPQPAFPREPQPTDPAFQPKREVMDSLMRKKREAKEREAFARFEAYHRHWQQMCGQIKHNYEQQWLQYQKSLKAAQAKHEETVRKWQQDKEAFLRQREACIALIKEKTAAFHEREANAVLDFFDMALAQFSYPTCFPHSYEMDYDETNRLLVVDYLMPTLRALPRLVKVDNNEDDELFHEVLLSENEQSMLYARLLQELPLRIFYELYSIDTADALNAISFRGHIFLENNKKQQRPVKTKFLFS